MAIVPGTNVIARELTVAVPGSAGLEDGGDGLGQLIHLGLVLGGLRAVRSAHRMTAAPDGRAEPSVVAAVPVRSAGAGPVVEGLALAVIVRGGVSFPGGRYVAPIASATRRASPEFSEPGARRTPRNRHLRTLPGERPPGCTRIPRCRMSYQVIFAVDPP